MKCDVSTGSMACTPANSGGAGNRYATEAVFDAHSASRYSPRVFDLQPGDALVVSVFELAGAPMYVNKVALSAGKMPHGVSCPTACDERGAVIPPGAAFPTMTYQKRVVTNGVPWAMSDGDDTKVITAPGAYRFELDNDAQVGETYVEARLYKGGAVPAQMVFGHAVDTTAAAVDLLAQTTGDPV